MPQQEELDNVYLQMATTWSSLSKARRKKVGCLVVKNDAIISDGYNGTPAGFDNNCEIVETGGTEDSSSFDYCSVTKPEVIHAEANALAKLAKSTQSSAGATMYITISPCVECAKLIIQSGIDRLVYGEVYRSVEGLDLLEKAFVEVSLFTGLKNEN